MSKDILEAVLPLCLNMLQQDCWPNGKERRALVVGDATTRDACERHLKPKGLGVLFASSDPGKEGGAITDLQRIPLVDASVHLVVLDRVLHRHDSFWQVFQEMGRLLSEDGAILVVTPDASSQERTAPYCINRRGMEALTKLIGGYQREVFLTNDPEDGFATLIYRQLPAGMFSGRSAAVTAVASSPAMTLPVHSRNVRTQNLPDKQQIELMRGAAPYMDILKLIHQTLLPELYLEIGVRNGASLALAKCPAVGVDPAMNVTAQLGSEVKLVHETSDAFFAGPAAELEGRSPDLAFIDGMHLFEYALRDFMNIEKIASPATVVVVDDIFPNHPLQAARDRQTRCWTGDIWKFRYCLEEFRPDLTFMMLDTHPTGLMLIFGLNPDNRVLQNNYDRILEKYLSLDFALPPAKVVARQEALPPDSEFLSGVCAFIKDARASNDPRHELERLTATLSGNPA